MLCFFVCVGYVCELFVVYFDFVVVVFIDDGVGVGV